MIVGDKKIDEILRRRKERVLKSKKPLAIPKLKFYKLTGDKRGLNIKIDIPIKENLVIREKFDYHLDDSVDIPKFVKKIQDKYSFSDEIRDNIENSISFQIISHVEKVTLKAKMTKLQKLEKEKKFEERRRNEEVNNLHQYKDRIRKVASSRNLSGTRMSDYKDRFGENECNFCHHINMKSEQSCRNCRIPLRLMDEDPAANDVPRKNALGFLSRMLIRSDMMKTFNLTNRLEYQDLSSIMTLQAKIKRLIMSRMDFDLESKEELIKMFENYMYNYTMLSLYFCDIYPFFDNKNDVSKERIQVVSEKRGKPGRPKKTEVIKKYLKKTKANPVGRPKMTEADKKKMFEARMRKKRRRMKRGKKGRFLKKEEGMKVEEKEEVNENADLELEGQRMLGKRSKEGKSGDPPEQESAPLVKQEPLEDILEASDAYQDDDDDESYEEPVTKKLKV